MKRYPKISKFIPKHPEKYEGNIKNIEARSSWELRVMKFFDEASSIIAWSSEELIIRYVSPVDNKYHRYFPDFKIKVNGKTGIRTYIIEVKPHKEIVPVIKGNKRKSTYLNEMATYAVNQAKWAAANNYCKDRGWEFKTLSEYDLGIKK